MKVLDALAAKKVGLGFAHYGVEVPKGDPGAAMHRWVGGYYEHQFSVNPMWAPDYRVFPSHPVTRGVGPFSNHDEWYFNMRFVDGRKGVTPILAAVPDNSVTSRPDGAHSGNPEMRAQVARGDAQVVSWAYERPDGGRGFGFTGAHYHANWGNEDFRRIVLNAILWLAKIDVPAGGVRSSVTEADVAANLDPKPAPKRKADAKK